MDLRQIRFFVAVAEDGQFGRAAERMFVPQPALGQHVRRLERELGAPLLDGSDGHVRLTPAGEAFLEVARRMLRQVDAGADAGSRAEAGELDRLTVGAQMAVAAPVLSVLLRHWNHVRPAVQPRLTSGRTRDLVDLVRRRELDLALVEGPVTDGELNSAVVIEDPLVVVLPADHPLAREEAVTLRSLRRERFVAVARRTSMGLHDRLIELCAAAGFSPDITLEVDDPDLLAVAVAGGSGVGLGASVSVVGKSTPGVVWRPIVDAEATIPLVAVSARTGATPQTREFLLLVENLRRQNRLQPPATVDVTDDRPDGRIALEARPRLLEAV